MITPNDFSKICRICLSNNLKMVDLFVNDLDKQYAVVTGLKIPTDDELPKQLCSKCSSAVGECFRVVCQAKDSEEYLMEVLKLAEFVKSEDAEDEKEDVIYVITVPEKEEVEQKVCIKPVAVSDDIKNICSMAGSIESEDHNYPKIKLKDEIFQSNEINVEEFHYVTFVNKFKSKKYYVTSQNDYIKQCMCNLDVLPFSTMAFTICVDDKGIMNEALECPVCFLQCDTDFLLHQHLSLHKDKNIDFVKTDSAGFATAAQLQDAPFTPIVQLLSSMTLEGNQFFFMPEIFTDSFVKDQEIYLVIDPLACIYCAYEADTSFSLDIHCKEMHNIDGFVESYGVMFCPKCGFMPDLVSSYKWKTQLVEHLTLHKKVGCHFVRIRRNGLLMDIDSSSSEVLTTLTELYMMYCGSVQQDSTFTCDTCSAVFYQKEDITAHLNTHLEESAYVCEKCGVSFKTEKTFRKHVRTHIKKSKKHECSVCCKKFPTKTQLNKHFVQHGYRQLLKAICEICGKSFSSNSALNKHRKFHLNKQKELLSCDLCHKTYTKKALFNKHQQAHLKPNYLECTICQYPLPSQTSLERHIETHLRGSGETFDCEVCHLSFLSKDGLTSHRSFKGHHKAQPPFECNVCQEKFFVGKQFTQHIKKHPKYKMSECNLCGKRLATVQSLMWHKSRHFDNNSILCPHCGCKFYEDKNYRRHLLTHEGIKPFSCNEEGCGKSFYTAFEIKRHGKYHSNTRDFACQYCSKRFHESNHLKVHVRTHTGEKPYTCPHCSKGFVTRTRCKQHIKLLHQGIGYDLIQSKISKKVILLESSA